MRRAYSQQTLKILWGRSGNRCAKPGCYNRLVVDATQLDDEAIIGQIAHIVGSSDSGPRSAPSFPSHRRDRPENLILLCANHHVEVDRQDSTYTVDELRRWKSEHEGWVEQQLETAATEVTFAELEVVTGAVATAPPDDGSDLSLLTVREKMARNYLTGRVGNDMAIGLLAAPVVHEFIESYSAFDANFGERLRGGFVAEYERLRGEGLAGDELYEALVAFASTGTSDFRRQAAGRAVRAHLFEVCDVFER